MENQQSLSEYFRFIKRFGVLKGTALYGKIKLGSQQELAVPGINFPVSLRKNTSDYETFYQAIVHSQYKFNYHITPEVIIDGGANIGLASIALKNLYPQAKIIAIEPDTENFAQLNKNLQPYNNIHTIQAGLWNKRAILKVSDKYSVGKWGMVTEEVEEMSPSTIATITIGEIMEKYQLIYIDLLKLDIETAERELFSSDYEDWLPKIKVIVIELVFFHYFSYRNGCNC
jgi:FkbM family methyltransferase